MDRRAFLAGTGALLAAPLAAEAQQSGRTAKIGLLTPQSSEVSRPSWDSFRQGLRELGWQDGRNIVIEARFADGKFDRLHAFARELIGLAVQLIVAANSPGIRAAMAVTTTIPIVMVEVGDPIATGFVTNLARPGGNVTGLTNIARDLTQKRLELLKEAVPGAARVGVIMDPDDPITRLQWRDAETAAGRLRILLQRREVRNADDLRRAFQEAVSGRADAMLRLADALAADLGAETVDLAMKHRLPMMLTGARWVQAGGLMSYFADPRDYYRRAALYVDKILRGTQPGDLPIEQPTKFELVINLRTAKALGLAIRPSLLQQADQVIE